MKQMIRPPAVAGRFYPSDPKELETEILDYTRENVSAKRIRARGCLVPHAGYMYSGHVAGAVYATLDIPQRCILIGPRHFPHGAPMSILTEGSWHTPLGDAPIDSELASAVGHECPMLREDSVAHEREHSLEVQVPFLQELVPGMKFVPIVIVTDRYGAMEEVGRAIARVVSSMDAKRERVLVIASSDLNHYEDDAATRVKDGHAIEKVLALDPRGLYETVRNESISMCGYAATVSMLVAMKELGANEAKLIRYATSADINGIRDEVVGYAGIMIS